MADETEPKRGPGRPPKDATSVPGAGTSTLIYSPLDSGDPHTVEWNGVTFKANLPKELRHATHGDMIALAKGNPHFSVDGKSSKRAAPTRDAVPLAGSDVDPTAFDDKRMVEADD
jgi:hypothetical protein